MRLELQQVIGKYIPSVYVDRVILRDNAIELKLSLKEILLDSKILSLSSFPSLQQYITLKIISSRDAEITSNILKLTQEELRNFSFVDSKITVYEEQLPLDSNDLQLDDLGFKTLILLKEEQLDTVDLQHLTYIVYCDLNIKEAIKNFDVELSNTKFTGKLTSESIIDSGNVIKNSFMYTLPDGTPWTGLIEKNGSIYQTQETPPRILVENVIPNEKIHDYRTKSIIISKPADQYVSLELENNLSRANLIKSNFNRNVLVSSLQNGSEISEESICKNSDSSISVFFTIDYNNLIKNNSTFANSVNSYSINELVPYMPIKTFKLYRKLVPNKDTAFSNIKLNQVPVLCTTNLQFVEKTNNIVMYKSTDITAKSVLDGKYQYYFEIEFENKTNKYFSEKIKNLIDLEKYVIEYYSQSLNKKNYNFKQNVFTKNMQNYYINKITNISMTDVVNVFIKAYFISDSKEISSDDVAEMRKKYLLYISPTEGSQEGVAIFKKNYSNLISILLDKLNIKQNKSKGSDLFQKKITDSKTNIFKKIKTIENEVDFKKLKMVEATYVPKINNAIIPLVSFVDRIKQEKSFFNLSDTKDNYSEEYMYSYISPAYLYVDSKTYSVLSQNIPDTTFESVLNNISLINKNIKKVDVHDGVKKYDDSDQINLLKNTYNRLLEYGASIQIDSNISKIPDNTQKTTHIDNIEKDKAAISKSDGSGFDVFTFSKFLNKNQNAELSGDIPASAPNQIKSLKGLSLDKNLAKNIIKYRMLCEIYYLDMPGTKDRNWKLLTKSSLLNSFRKKSYLICRLNRHKYNYNKGIYHEIDTHINEYFIIDMSDKKLDINNVLNLKDTQPASNKETKTLSSQKTTSPLIPIPSSKPIVAQPAPIVITGKDFTYIVDNSADKKISDTMTKIAASAEINKLLEQAKQEIKENNIIKSPIIGISKMTGLTEKEIQELSKKAGIKAPSSAQKTAQQVEINKIKTSGISSSSTKTKNKNLNLFNPRASKK